MMEMVTAMTMLLSNIIFHYRDFSIIIFQFFKVVILTRVNSTGKQKIICTKKNCHDVTIHSKNL